MLNSKFGEKGVHSANKHKRVIQERKRREKDQRIQSILEAAKKVFFSKGYLKVTMDEIALEAEISKPTIYQYFKTKDDLYASLNLQLLEYLYERMEGLCREQGLNASEKLEALKDLLHDVFNFDPLILINLFHLQASDGLMNLSTERTTQLNELAAKCLRTLGKIFEDGMAEGRFVKHNPIALGDIIWILFTGAVLWEESKRMINPRKDYLKQTLDLAIDIFGRGIKAT